MRTVIVLVLALVALAPASGLAQDLGDVRAMEADARGNLYLARGTGIVQLKPDGRETDLASVDGQVISLSGGPRGRLYALDEAGSIYRIHADGTVELLAMGLKGASAIAVDRDGTVMVTDVFGTVVPAVP